MRIHDLIFLLAALFFGACRPADPPAARTVEVQIGVFEQWTALPGTVHPVNTLSVLSPFDGAATITDIATDGQPVAVGDVLVRFDPSVLEERLIERERDLRLARAEHEGLTAALHPLELEKLQLVYLEAVASLDEQQQQLRDTEELVAEGLLSDREADQLRARVRQELQRTQSISNQVVLTRTRLHPLANERSQARLDAAAGALAQVQAQLSNSVIRAGRQGVVRRLPVFLAQERRPLRVGDVVYKNQALLEIADLRQFEVHSELVESQLSRVQPGMPARVSFPAFPGLQLQAQVRQVGVYPDPQTGRFPATLEFLGSDDRLRPGMTAHCQVLSQREDSALWLPRMAVRWEADGPRVQVITAAGVRDDRQIQSPAVNATQVWVTSGVSEGERVVLP